MRSPVYEPGPELTATASRGIAWLSANEMASSTNDARYFVCEFASLLFFSKITLPSWQTATEHVSVDDSMANMQDTIATIFKLMKSGFNNINFGLERYIYAKGEGLVELEI